MNKYVLWTGAVIMIAIGIMLTSDAYTAGGIVLVWIGGAVYCKENL